MTVVFNTTWPGSNGAAWPVQWTTSVAGTGSVADTQSNFGRLLAGTSGAYTDNAKAILSNSTFFMADCECLVKWLPNNPLSEEYLALYLRATGDWANGDNPNTWYSLQLDNGGNLALIYRVLSGTKTTIGTAVHALVAGIPLWMRFRLQGTHLQGKLWNDNIGEPGPWDIDVIDSHVPAAGYFQLCNAGGSAATAKDSRVQFLTLDDLTGGGGSGRKATSISIKIP